MQWNRCVSRCVNFDWFYKLRDKMFLYRLRKWSYFLPGTEPDIVNTWGLIKPRRVWGHAPPARLFPPFYGSYRNYFSSHLRWYNAYKLYIILKIQRKKSSCSIFGLFCIYLISNCLHHSDTITQQILRMTYFHSCRLKRGKNCLMFPFFKLNNRVEICYAGAELTEWLLI